jgi:hypothetical protein
MTDRIFGTQPMAEIPPSRDSYRHPNAFQGDDMFKKSILGAAAVALLGISGLTLATTVIDHSPVVGQDGIKEKKVILHDNGDRTVVKKKTQVNAYGQTSVKKKVVRHAAGTPSNVTVVHRTGAPAVVVHRVVRPVPARTTIIRETTG